MKKAIIYLVASLGLGLCGCLQERGLEDCPGEMALSFYLDDAYIPGTYDDRIANDVRLYIFKDDICINSILVPYYRISQGQLYRMTKSREMDGDIDLVAWAVPAGHSAGAIPVWNHGDALGQQYLYEERVPNYEQYYVSGPDELYRGRVAFVEPYTQASSHAIGMMYAACRVEIYVTDQGERLYPDLPLLHTRVNGVMSRMDMNLRGTGEPASVLKRLECPTDDRIHFNTTRFGVLPSSPGQTVSVDIRDGATDLATLTVPSNLLPRGAWAGGLMIFEYEMGDTYFTLEVNGWRQNVYDVDAL